MRVADYSGYCYGIKRVTLFLSYPMSLSYCTILVYWCIDSGMRMPFSFKSFNHLSVMRVLLAVIAVTVSYVEQNIWVIAAIASMFIVITFYYVRQKRQSAGRLIN